MLGFFAVQHHDFFFRSRPAHSRLDFTQARLQGRRIDTRQEAAEGRLRRRRVVALAIAPKAKIVMSLEQFADARQVRGLREHDLEFIRALLLNVVRTTK